MAMAPGKQKMSLSDPIADMMTRIRNAQAARHEAVEMPHSKMKTEIARVMQREGYVKAYSVEGGPKKILRIYLRYTGDHEPLISGLRRDSTPGRRVYVAAGEIPRVLGGIGIAILSTSGGIVTDKEARKRKVGGEVLCSVW